MSFVAGEGENLPPDRFSELVLAFDTDDPEFVRGVEVGRLWELLDHAGEAELTIHGTNAEMAMRIAEAKGLAFRGDHLEGDWYHVRIGGPA